MSYVWRTNGTSYTLEYPDVVYNHIGESTKTFPTRGYKSQETELPCREASGGRRKP